MLEEYYDSRYNFKYFFNTKTGFYLRTGILDKDGNDTGIDPFMASYPHLIDVGIMGHCEHGKSGLCINSGVECYQNGLNIVQSNMSLEDFKYLLKQCTGKVNQFALGGRGDPDMHENFKEILIECKKNNIIPNFTTSGYGFNKEKAQLVKKYCGAVAVSWYRNSYTLNTIDLLVKEGVKTNIHYVLSNSSIDEAIERLQNDTFPKGINAVIFLLHKPAGLGTQKNVLSINDEKVLTFYKMIENQYRFKIGVDSCTIPVFISQNSNFFKETIDTCEGGRYSCYIDSNMVMTPCSFDRDNKYGISLKNKTVEEIWFSKEFDEFRYSLKNSCKNCTIRNECMGGCPLFPEVVLCDKK